MIKASSPMREHIYGEIPNIEIGHTFKDRIEAQEHGLHRDRTKGIVTYKGGPAYSVDISAFDPAYSYSENKSKMKGKYANYRFANFPDIYVYLGEGGTDDKVHYNHQTLSAGNRGLINACEQSEKIRVITREDPSQNTRTYKGLFQVKGFVPGYYDGYFAFEFILCSNENSWNNFIRSNEYIQFLSGNKLYISIADTEKLLESIQKTQTDEDKKNIIKAAEYEANRQVESEKKFSNYSNSELFNLVKGINTAPTNSNNKKHQRIKKTTRYEYSRNPALVTLRLRMSKGICGLCHKPGPFHDPCLGYDFLEVHHIRWLSKQGDDVIENTVGLCPNCHTKVHFQPSIEFDKEMKNSAWRDYDFFLSELKQIT